MKLNSSIFILVFLLSSSFTLASAQSVQDSTFEFLEGYWEGAKIKSNAYQKIEMDFYREEDEYKVRHTIPDFNPVFGSFVGDVIIDSLGNISCPIWSGDSELKLDKDNLELVGYQPDQVPPISVHLKKKPRPEKDYRIEEVKVKNVDINIEGHLHIPNRRSIESVAIFVYGRGCMDVSSENSSYAAYLRKYGIAVLTYFKRGTQTSGGDCNTATIQDLASDLLALKSYLENHSLKFKNIGAIGSSAGAWVTAKAQEQNADFDFMIHLVGPSTSVYDQQIQSMEYGLDEYELTSQDKTDLINYTKLCFNAEATEASLAKFNELLEKGKQNGWVELLDDTDIPASVAGIDSLWVRRHNYDPQQALSNFNKPMLSVFGDSDWVVPYKENIQKLESYFSGERQHLLTTVIAHDSGHGLYSSKKQIILDGNTSYWRFLKIPPQAGLEMVGFLRKNDFIN